MKSKPNLRIALLGVVGALVTEANAGFVYSPSRAIQPIDANAWPFFVTSEVTPSFRYQEWRNASEFSSVGSPMLITGFSLWRSPLSLPIDFTLPNVEINFSTTQRSRSTFGRVFADNIGPDETTVFSGALHLVDTGGEYGIHIPLQTPFLYDPSQGNFLMDFQIYQTVPEPGLGGYGVFFLRTAFDVRLASAVDANASTGDSVSNGGVFTRFTVTPVPEPSTWALLAAAVAALAFNGRTWKRNH